MLLTFTGAYAWFALSMLTIATGSPFALILVFLLYVLLPLGFITVIARNAHMIQPLQQVNQYFCHHSLNRSPSPSLAAACGYFPS